MHYLRRVLPGFKLSSSCGLLLASLAVLLGPACHQHPITGAAGASTAAGGRQAVSRPKTAQPKQEADLLRQYLLTLQDPQSGSLQLHAAMEGLGKLSVRELPDFWVRIVNNPVYKEDRRREAVVQLFSRHFPPGTRISHISKLAGTQDWFTTNNIFNCTVASHLPIEDRGECAFMYQPEILASNQTKTYRSGGYVVFSLKKYFSVADLVQILHGERSGDGTEILELAASPGDFTRTPQ